ncbi:MAG: CBS domain-containing protein [Gammaproteobacteria bacterium]|nr:CBS domain-containing protein [Gammaproteobacteria bacterium]
MSEQREARVEDVMVTDLYNINGLASVGEAMQMMKKHRVSSLVVDRRDADDEVGLVEVADVANEVIARNRAPDRVSVYEVMTKPVVTLPPGMLVRYAVRLLARLGHSRAVVVDDARNAVGMVTLRDLVLGPRED